MWGVDDMEIRMGRLLSTLYGLCKWITHFAYLNLLWVFFTLLGIGIFGIFPSTVALYTVARKNTMNEDDTPIFSTFFEAYKQELFKANCLGWLIVFIGLIWYFDLHFFRQFNGLFFNIMNYFMIIVGLIYIALLLFIFPVYVHYDLKLRYYIKQALTIAFLRPGNLSLIFLGTLGAYYFYITVPAFIPLFGISLLVYFHMWVAFNGFESIHSYAQKIKSTESKDK